MAETQRSMSSRDAGNATDSSLKTQLAHGVSGVPVVNPKINQVNFFDALDSLVDRGRAIDGCTVGKMVIQLEKPLQDKLNEIFRNKKVNSVNLMSVMLAFGLEVSSSDVLRRHRRRLMGRDGCKCPNES